MRGALVKVFLSHAGADIGLARRLSEDLRSARVDIWLDQWEIGVGEEFANTIEQGLHEAQFVIVLLTRASVASDWVRKEWSQSLKW